MRIAVLQPSYLPWLGYLDQMASVDAFVFYDDVQFDRNGWRNRNRIRTASEQGWSWLTIPVLLHGFPPINDVRVDQRVPWRRKHLATLLSAYSRAPFRGMLADFEALFESTEDRFAEVAIQSTKLLATAFAIDTPMYRSSELGVTGNRNTRLIDICKRFDATEYLSGVAARAYLDESLFEQNGIRVLWQEYEHPVYEQFHGAFISHLSSIDALMNCGSSARDFIRNKEQLTS